MTAGLRFFFRHIHVTGLENIPEKGPAVLIANHNSSLMDAALLGILLKRKAWFFARGDVFVNGPVRTLLRWFHMMPVHTYRGGKKSLGVNQHSFSDGQRILAAGGIIVFFPESSSHIEHQLLPFRKGVFRLAFDTAAATGFSFDIPIVPIGINYDHPVNCRTDVQVHAGKPLLLSAYKDEYRLNAPAALLHVCKDAQQAVCGLVLHIHDKQRLLTAEQYLAICRAEKKQPVPSWKIPSAQQLQWEQGICSTLNSMPQEDFNQNSRTINNYFDVLTTAGLQDRSIAVSFSAAQKTRLFLGFPFYITGLLLNGLPVFIARQVVNKKVYRQDFYSWIFVACYSLMYFSWLMALLLLSFLFGWIYAVSLLALMIVTGIFAYVYKDWLRDVRQQQKLRQLSEQELDGLKAMRRILVRSIPVPHSL